MKNHNRILGEWGESEAEKYLNLKGYQIIDKNFYTPYGEIDIICRKGNNLIFVEVKTRRNTTFGNPEVSINQRKLEHMENSAKYYVQENEFSGTWQIDAISISKNNSSQVEIVHFENVIS